MSKMYKLLFAAFFISHLCTAQFSVTNLLTQNQVAPIGIDDKLPAFTWQMSAPGQYGASQSAWQIVVKDPKGTVVWDSKKITSGLSLNIPYAGSALQPSTKYNWTVTVWDQKGKTSSQASTFETGLMNPSISAWDGADWIGSNELSLYAPYLSVFRLKYTQTIHPGSTKGGFVFGANDARLMERNKNIYGVQNEKDKSYIKIELDIAPVDGTEAGKAKLNIYRAGYTDKDVATVPLATHEVLTTVINKDNKNSPHTVAFTNAFGTLVITIDGIANFTGKLDPPVQRPWGLEVQQGVTLNVNPAGRGWDFTTFGFLCDIGFAADQGQKVAFREVEVSHTRAPSNTLFKEDLTQASYKGIYSNTDNRLTIRNGAYELDGGAAGAFVVRDPSRHSTPIVRTKFATQKKGIASARLYVTARGVYEMYINGNKVGEDYFNPGLTQYNITHMYQTYDVTSMIKEGDNAIGAMMSEGWWSGLLSFGAIWNHFGDRQSLLAKLVITYNDGTTNVVTTNDRDWKYSDDGPIVYSSLDMGEVYDATKEVALAGWSTSAFNDASWKKAEVVKLQGTTFTDKNLNYDKFSLTGQIGNSAGVYKTLVAKSVKEVRKGVFVYDMGQNFVGVPKITFANGKAGNKVTLRFAEIMYPALAESGGNVGMVMLENYRAALCQDIYTMKDGAQVFQPKFTSRGYQYIEITGIDAALPLTAVEGIVTSSVLKLTADYETSNAKVNKLWSNLVWSNVDNFLSVPTDCPQRNERMGWSGDINVFARTATYVSNADQFLRRHLLAMRDVQAPTGRFTDIAPVGGGFGGVLWGSAGIVVAWENYLQYSNKAVLQEHYDAMAKYVDFLSQSLDKETGLSSDATLGDWLGPQNNQLGTSYLVTAYHVYDLWIMSQVAKVLGKNSDAERFSALHAERKAFFNKTFVNADHKTMGLLGGGFFSREKPHWEIADTQTSYAVGLALNVFSEENKPHMITNLAETIRRKNKGDDGIMRNEFSLMTGFIGTAWVNKALSDHGLTDLSYQLLQNDQYPSWLYAIDQGATTIWERLNGYTVENGFGGNNSMNSFNHYSFGAVGQWMIAYSLGIQRDETNPGFKHFILQPQPDPTGQMTYAKGYYESLYGKIESDWSIDEGTLTYRATVPANTSATLYLPATSAESVMRDGKKIKNERGLKFVKFENGKAVYELQSGSYVFNAR
jgi:alpha-L-rhamnosidase